MRILSLTELGRIKEEQQKRVMLRKLTPETGHQTKSDTTDNENQPATYQKDKTGQNGGY